MLDISDFPWAECVITETRNLYVADSLSGVRSKRSQGVHRFELELTTIDMPIKQGKAVTAKLSAAFADELRYIHPRLSYTEGVEPSGGLVLSRDAAVGATELYVIQSDAGEQWSIVDGDFINVGSDSKVFQVSNGSGEGLQLGEHIITLTSGLRYNTSSGMQIVTNGVSWLLESDGKIEYEMVASDNQDVPFTLLTVEKL